jgi:hypothetical protein
MRNNLPELVRLAAWGWRLNPNATLLSTLADIIKAASTHLGISRAPVYGGLRNSAVMATRLLVGHPSLFTEVIALTVRP